jgi:hypothetical protein
MNLHEELVSAPEPLVKVRMVAFGAAGLDPEQTAVPLGARFHVAHGDEGLRSNDVRHAMV